MVAEVVISHNEHPGFSIAEHVLEDVLHDRSRSVALREAFRATSMYSLHPAESRPDWRVGVTDAEILAWAVRQEAQARP